jgi:hypothetical protein
MKGNGIDFNLLTVTVGIYLSIFEKYFEIENSLGFWLVVFGITYYVVSLSRPKTDKKVEDENGEGVIVVENRLSCNKIIKILMLIGLIIILYMVFILKY